MKPFEPWSGTMTKRERFNAQMHYLPFDRTVNMEFGYWDENYSQWNLFTENGIRNESDADKFFAFEPPKTLGVNLWLAPGFKEEIIETKENSILKTNYEGILLEVPKDGHSSIPKYIRSSIETPEDWKKVKEEHFPRYDKSREPNYEYFDKTAKGDRDYPVGINIGSMIGKIRDILTVEGLAYAVYDYPGMVEDMVETVCTLTEDMLDKVLPKYHFDFAAGWEDICCKNGPLISMDFFKNAVYPRYKRIGDKLHKYGVDIWYMDCDGDVRPLLPYFLDAGINCLFPYEVNSCLHPADLCREYGKDLRIMGGVDKIKMIAGKEEIRKYLESIEPLVARGGFIPFCDHRCPPDVKPENYLYYLELKKEMFGMK